MNALKKFPALVNRHAQAFWYVLTVIVPILLRTGRRPVIFSKYSGIGDILCTFPAVLELKKRHPKATFIYNCYQPYACLPAMGGIAWQVTSLRQAGVLRHWYGWLCAAFYEFPSADESPDDFCRRYLVKEYAKNHGVEVEARHPDLTFSSAAKNKATEVQTSLGCFTSPKIIIHTGPTWPIKEWPQAAWLELVNELKKCGYANIIQVGTTHHLAMGTVADTALFVPGVVSLLNQLTLEETAAVIATASLFIGVDSGLIHLAASLNIPSVGIFGPTNPEIILPPAVAINSIVSRIPCQGCHHRIPRIHWEKGCPYDARCMKQISAAEVLAACLKVLNNSSPRNA